MPISNLRYFRVFYEEKYTEWIGLYKSFPPPEKKQKQFMKNMKLPISFLIQ